MSDINVEELLRAGRTMAERGEWSKALKVFQALYSRKKEIDDKETVAIITSFFGLAKVMGGKQWQEGLTLCEEARDLCAYLPETYVNIAQALMERPTEVNRAKAEKQLESALKIDPKNRAAMRVLEKVGGDQRAVFSFLSPSNPINVLLRGKKK